MIRGHSSWHWMCGGSHHWSYGPLSCRSTVGAALALVLHFSGADTPEFAKWYEGRFSECNINYTGNPGGKEAAAAESLWDRSVE